MTDLDKLYKYLSSKTTSFLEMSCTDLRDAKLLVNQSGNKKLKHANLRSANFDNSVIKFISFCNSNLSCISMRKSELFCCHFDSANLESAILNNSEISLCGFPYVNLINSNLTETSLSASSFYYSNFEEAILVRADASNTEFIHCNLQKANLESANLSGADFSHCNFSNANLTNANLKYTNLNGVNLTGADLTGIKICESDTEIASIIGEDNLKKAIILPYFPPIHKSLNFIFESHNYYIKFNSNDSISKTAFHTDYLTSIKIKTEVYRDSVRYYLSIETLHKDILSLKEKINISDNPLILEKEENNKITLKSLTEDAQGNSLPSYEISILLSETNEILKCILYLRSIETYFEFI